MNMNLNETVTVVGNIGGTLDQRQTPAGPVTSFRLGSTHRKFDKQRGEWVDDYTNWFSVNVWRALGEHALHSFRKGERVIVTGRLRAREWETETKRGVTLEIDAVALGHDLLWGTSAFSRDAPGGGAPAEQTASAPAAGDWGAPAESEGWTTATVPDPVPEPAEIPF